MELDIAIDWTPLPHQLRLINSTERVVGMFGGQGSGKTDGGAYAMLLHGTNNPGLRSIIVAPTAPLLHGTTLSAFRDACPPELIADENKQQRWIELINRHRYYYWSADGKTKLTGFNAAGFWLDGAEDVEHSVFLKLLSRLREPRATRLRGFVTGTPSLGWIYEEFGEPREFRELISVATADNPYIGADYINDLRKSYDQATFNQLVLGKFVALSGLVYGDLHPTESFCDQGPSKGIETWVGVDLGFNRPAIVFVQRRIGFGRDRLSDDEYVIIDQEMPEQGSAAELAEIIRKRGYRVASILVDPSVTVDERIALEKAGPIVRAKGEDAQSRRLGVDRVRAAIRDATGKRRLFLFRGLRQQEAPWRRGIVKDLSGYRWPKHDRDGALKREPWKDGLHDHGCDAVRYVVAFLLPGVAQQVETRYTR